MKHRFPDYLSSAKLIAIGEDNALQPVSGRGGDRPNEVLWWHWCSTDGQWHCGGLGKHTLTGDAEQGTMTIRASLLCWLGCGMHGWVTDNLWTGC